MDRREEVYEGNGKDRRKLPGIIKVTPEVGPTYFEIRVTARVGKRRVQRRGRAATKTEAKRIHKELSRDVATERKRRTNPDAPRTFAELADAFEQTYIHESKRDESGVQTETGYTRPYTYRYQLDAAREFFGSMSLDKITSAHILDYVRELQKPAPRYYRQRNGGDLLPRRDETGNVIMYKRDPQTVGRYLALLRRVLYFAADELRAIERSPWQNLQKQSVPRKLAQLSKPRQRQFEPEEIAAILEVCENNPRRRHLYEIILVNISTGRRLGDLFRLQWKDVDLTHGIMRVHRATTKTGKDPDEDIPLPDNVLALFTQLRQERKPVEEDHVFLYRGRPFNKITDGFKAAARDAGVKDAKGRDLRNGFGYLAWSKLDAAMPQISEQLGHSNTQVTARYYARKSTEDRRPMAQSVAQLVTNAIEKRREEQDAKIN